MSPTRYHKDEDEERASYSGSESSYDHRKLLARRESYGDSSTGCIAPSVLSKYNSSRFGAPNPSKYSSSYPPYPPHESSSSARDRYVTGIPSRRYEPGSVAGSSPILGGMHDFDEYRKAMDEHTIVRAPIDREHIHTGSYAYNPGPPLDSDFSRRSSHYHDLEVSARSREDEYDGHFLSARHLDYEGGTVSEEMEDRLDEPYNYGGKPTESREWHGRAADLAGRTSKAYEDVLDARQDMGSRYVGYDTYKGARGHRERNRVVKGFGNHMTRQEHSHDDWTSN